MGAVYATVEDLAAFWRPLSVAEETRAATLLRYASQRIRLRVSGIDESITAGTVDPADAELVVLSMVKRAMLSTDYEGITQESQASGPFSHGATYANPMGNLYITDDEVRDLGGNPSSGRAKNVRLLGGYC